MAVTVPAPWMTEPFPCVQAGSDRGAGVPERGDIAGGDDHAAGGICDATAPTPSILLCSRITGTGRAADEGTETVFVRINTGDHHGAYSLDPSTCLAEPRLDPAGWIAQAARHGPPDPAMTPPMATECLRTVWNEIDTARDLVVRDHDIPAGNGTERVHPIAWLYLTPHPAC